MFDFQVYLVGIFISFWVGFFRRKSLPKSFDSLILLLGITFIVELLSYIYILLYQHPLLAIFHFFQPIEYMLIAYYFWQELKNSRNRNLIKKSIPLFFLICFILSLFVQKLDSHNSIEFMIEALFVSTLSLIHIRQIIDSPEQSSFFGNPNIWITTGFLFFYVGGFLVMGLLDFLSNTNLILAEKLFTINKILNFLLLMLYNISFICSKSIIRWK